MCPDEVFIEFLSSFNDKAGTGLITYSEWNDYYAGVSASIEKDENFISLIRNCWDL
jgi:hypothetical protein